MHQRHDPRAIDLGNVAIIPGLVNANVHLEFSEIVAPIEPAAPFTDWLRAVISHRRSGCGLGMQAAMALGHAECGDTGTVLIGDIATPGWDARQCPAVARVSSRFWNYWDCGQTESTIS